MKNYKLEFIRGFAAFLVFFTHLTVSKIGLQNPVLGILSNWGTESVMAFFILSGVVIAMSYEKSRAGFSQFISRRLIRLYPLLIISLIFAYTLLHFLLLQHINVLDVIGNFLLLGTLDGKILLVPDTNVPIWSLSYEIFFYGVFSMIFLIRSDKYIYGWLALSLLAIPFYYKSYAGVPGYLVSHIAFSAPWIIGFLAYKFARKLNFFTIYDALFFAAMLPAVARLKITQEFYCVIKYDLLALVAFPVFVYAINSTLPKVNSGITDKIKLIKLVLYLLVAAGLYFISDARPMARVIYVLLPIITLFFGNWFIVFMKQFKQPLISLSFFLGSISYGLYIIHFPVLVLLNHIIANDILFLIAGTLASFTAAYVLEKKIQPVVARSLRRTSN